MAKEVKMFQVYPVKYVPGYKPYYCATKEIADGEIARMEAWTGVKWKMKEMMGDPDLLIW